MELLKEIVPNLRRVAYVVGVAGDTNAPPGYFKIREETRQIAASTLGFTWQVFPAAVENDYDEIFARLAAEHFDAAYIPGTPFSNNNASRICQLALRHRIPSVRDTAGWARSGLPLAITKIISGAWRARWITSIRYCVVPSQATFP
jgi:hypothetical protein